MNTTLAPVRVSQHMEYLPFGETLVEEHINSNNSLFKFNGKEYDEETGNYYYGARYYDPKWSIFISVDPLAEITGDAYGYCYQNPINLTDPTGMSAENDGFYRDLETNEVKYFEGDGYREGYEYLKDFEITPGIMPECVIGEEHTGVANFAYAYEIGEGMFAPGHALGIDFETGKGYEIFHPTVDGKIVSGVGYAWPGGIRASYHYTWQIFEPGTLKPYRGKETEGKNIGLNFWDNGGILGEQRAPLGLKLDLVRVKDITYLRTLHSNILNRGEGHQYIVNGVCSNYAIYLINSGNRETYPGSFGPARLPSLSYNLWDNSYEIHIKNPNAKE